MRQAEDGGRHRRRAPASLGWRSLTVTISHWAATVGHRRSCGEASRRIANSCSHQVPEQQSASGKSGLGWLYRTRNACGNFFETRDDVLVMRSDAEMLRQSVRDPDAFADLYRRHRASVARYVARRLGADSFEDAAAEVFIRAFRARAMYVAERDSALPWLLGIANHVIGDHRRVEARRLAALSRAVADRRSVPAPEIRAVAPDVVDELRRLPKHQRDTLLLVVWGELSYEEAASGLGVPVGTVRSRIARARTRLARALEQQSMRRVTK